MPTMIEQPDSESADPPPHLVRSDGRPPASSDPIRRYTERQIGPVSGRSPYTVESEIAMYTDFFVKASERPGWQGRLAKRFVLGLLVVVILLGVFEPIRILLGL
jgi:hypothetical protein